MSNNSDDSVKIVKKAGGSIVDHNPVFSNNSKLVFVGCGPILRIFSTETGEHVQDVDVNSLCVEKPEGSIVSICLHPFENNNLIIAFEDGRVVVWSLESNSIEHNQFYNIENKNVVKMKIHVTSEHMETFDIVLAVKVFKESRVYMYLMVFDFVTTEVKCKIRKLFDFRMHSWSITQRGGCDFIAGINSNTLGVFNLKTKKMNNDIIIGSERYFMCVICHPLEECIAAGDNTGRIILYYDFLKPNVKSPYNVLHWHSLPVNDIIFSQTGTLLYSGGNEHVLVKWNTESPEIRHFLPRLSAPIVHLTTSTDNQFLAVSTLDNAILIVSPQMRLHCALQQFTWGFQTGVNQKLFPAGLVVDPRSNCIVLNGKPGHIQFYSTQFSSLLYNVDVVSQNYISQEKDRTIVNTEVTAVQFSFDGMWMTTAQKRNDPDFKTDTLMKFWVFNSKTQSYTLNSCIMLHYTIEKILYQPSQENYDYERKYVVVTACSDGKFRMWVNEGYMGQKFIWGCSSVGYYREHDIFDINFTNDGSLLGAAFGPCLTLWDAETNEMKTSLAKGTDPLKQVVFGQNDLCHIAVVATNKSVLAWDLLTLTMIWKIEINVSFLISDPKSDYIALFTPSTTSSESSKNTNSVHVFRASSPTFIYERERICEPNVEVLNATFFPKSSTNNSVSSLDDNQWLRYSTLYFFRSDQQLMAFETNKDSSISEIVTSATKQTPYSALVASEITSDVKKPEPIVHIQLGNKREQMLLEFANSPAHAMPPVHQMCESLLQLLMISE